MKPGASTEIQDLEYLVYSDCVEGGREWKALKDWSMNMVEAGERSGRPLNAVAKVADLLRNAGFVVTEEIRHMPIGSWPRDPGRKRLGRVVGEMLTSGLEGLSLRLFTRYLGWTKEETLVYLTKVRKSIRDRNVKAYFKVYVTLQTLRQQTLTSASYALRGYKPLHGI